MSAKKNAGAGIALALNVVGFVALFVGVGWAVNIYNGDQNNPFTTVIAYLILAAHITATMLMFGAATLIQIASDCEEHLTHVRHHALADFKERHQSH